jgi:hypothetical protein
VPASGAKQAPDGTSLSGELKAWTDYGGSGSITGPAP